MRIQPRRQILAVWHSLLSSCYVDGEWIWGGRDGSNSISDAEQLLCLLYPATEISSFALDNPDELSDDVAAVLAPFGRGAKIGSKLVEVLEDYWARYTGPDGEPIFSAGTYLRATAAGREPTRRQRELDVVDSYSMSLTLCLAALKFLRAFRRWVKTRPTPGTTLETRMAELEEKVAARLTAAMTGLVRSFVVFTVDPLDPTEPAGRNMLRMFNQTGASDEAVVATVNRRLDRLRVRLRRDVTLSQTPDIDLEDETLLFECGWSWGVAKQAAPIEFVDAAIADQPGYAVARPYLYFTVVALDGINDLTSPRTRELDLLDADQRRLAEALQLRWDLAQRYWSAMARYGEGRWPLEDIPWRTSDGEESDYFSLSVSAVLIQDLINREASDDDLTRATPVFDELARRGRIIRRLTVDDSARELHVPGVRLSLLGTEDVDDGGRLEWTVSDYAPVLLKRTLQAARLSGTLTTRDRLLELAQSTMDHLERRAFKKGQAEGLWDNAEEVFRIEPPNDGRYRPSFADTAAAENEGADPRPSWYLTERVIECLVAADLTFREPPLRSTTSAVRALELLNEAEHLLNQKLLQLSELDMTKNRLALETVHQQLERARSVFDERPGTAHSLCAEALRELDGLVFADEDAQRSV
ncbi:SCO2524 family protein [Nocardia blacklockiae]|uniref:SCO2524 family protein n=1 Tax=Nocardia blacklockiae TaxID=480036 RepID=UPI0018931772|nr:SCO2524 family protein [Nocardia blacklockiae]MBF6174057.1 hypothetical protein [Nocardia blacklockiae]